jgi:SAM-dependent methyltransferase
MKSHDPAHFQRLYDTDPDPWQLRTSAYEEAKYRKSVDCLGGRHFRSVFEAGCSVGVLTGMLARHCDRMLSVDFVDQALTTARAACADQPWVRFQKMTIPGEWPEDSFDLIVLSEVLYFLTPADIGTVAQRTRHSLASDGLVLVVNWRGHGDDPCSGDEAAQFFIDATRDWLEPRCQHLNDGYRLDLLGRR